MDGPNLLKSEVLSSLWLGDIYTDDQQTLITSSVTDMCSETFYLVYLPWPWTVRAALPSKLPLLGGSGYLRMLSLMHRCLKGPGGIGLQFSLLIKN